MNDEKREATMDWLKKASPFIDEMNAAGIRAALVVITPDSRVSTRKTDNFNNLAEYIGIWEAAKFQDSVVMWNLQSKVASRENK